MRPTPAPRNTQPKTGSLLGQAWRVLLGSLLAASSSHCPCPQSPDPRRGLRSPRPLACRGAVAQTAGSEPRRCWGPGWGSLLHPRARAGVGAWISEFHPCAPWGRPTFNTHRPTRFLHVLGGHQAGARSDPRAQEAPDFPARGIWSWAGDSREVSGSRSGARRASERERVLG